MIGIVIYILKEDDQHHLYHAYTTIGIVSLFINKIDSTTSKIELGSQIEFENPKSLIKLTPKTITLVKNYSAMAKSILSYKYASAIFELIRRTFDDVNHNDTYPILEKVLGYEDYFHSLMEFYLAGMYSLGIGPSIDKKLQNTFIGFSVGGQFLDIDQSREEDDLTYEQAIRFFSYSKKDMQASESDKKKFLKFLYKYFFIHGPIDLIVLKSILEWL